MKNLSNYILEKLIVNKDFKNPYSKNMEKLFDKNTLGKVSYEKDKDSYSFEISSARFEKIIDLIFDNGEQMPELLSVEKNTRNPKASVTYLKNTGDFIAIVLAGKRITDEPIAILAYNSERTALIFKTGVSALTPVYNKTDSRIEIGQCNTLNFAVFKMDFDFVNELDNILSKSI